MNLNDDLIEFFLESNLAFIKSVPFKSIIFDMRTQYMCKFGCKNFGRNYSCPPSSLSLYEYIMKRKFKWAILCATSYKLPEQLNALQIRSLNYQKEREIQRISMKIHSLVNKYNIDHVVLSGGGCKKCKVCSLIKGKNCKKPSLSLTSMEAVGIDCQKTLHKAGFDFEMPSQTSINRCSAILIDNNEISQIYQIKHNSYQNFQLPNVKKLKAVCDELIEYYPNYINDIEIKETTFNKSSNICNSNCKSYNKNYSCPPYSSSIELNLWKYAILWEWNKNSSKRYSYNNALRLIHSNIFSNGCYFALSLRDCNCDECNHCTFSPIDKNYCNFRKLLAPSMQSQGINPKIFGDGKYGIELF